MTTYRLEHPDGTRRPADLSQRHGNRLERRVTRSTWVGERCGSSRSASDKSFPSQSLTSNGGTRNDGVLRRERPRSSGRITGEGVPDERHG